jgi:hypothetical protein
MKIITLTKWIKVKLATITSFKILIFFWRGVIKNASKMSKICQLSSSQKNRIVNSSLKPSLHLALVLGRHRTHVLKYFPPVMNSTVYIMSSQRVAFQVSSFVQ